MSADDFRRERAGTENDVQLWLSMKGVYQERIDDKKRTEKAQADMPLRGRSMLYCLIFNRRVDSGMFNNAAACFLTP